MSCALSLHRAKGDMTRVNCDIAAFERRLSSACTDADSLVAATVEELSLLLSVLRRADGLDMLAVDTLVRGVCERTSRRAGECLSLCLRGIVSGAGDTDGRIAALRSLQALERLSIEIREAVTAAAGT